MNDATLGTRVHDDHPAVGAPGAHFDVLIIGAGLSGIGAACHLVRRRPKTTFAILEARNAIGGTWDLFRYPGIRSDSDMSTFGYAFRPWDDSKAIADGPSILRYLADTAKAFGVDRHIRFGFKVVQASWRSKDASWTLDVEGTDGEKLAFSCSFVILCTGYYEYEAGYMPGWPGMEKFAGRDRASTEMARRLEVRRQARGRHRQRRDGGDDRSGDGGKSSACCHAPTVANLCRRPPGRGGDRQRLKRRLPMRATHALTALEEHPLADVPL